MPRAEPPHRPTLGREPRGERVGAEVLLDDELGEPSGVRRSSHVASSSCSAALPMRIGGLRADRVEAHVGRRRRARPPHVGQAGGARRWRAQRQRPLVHVDAPTPSPPARDGRASRRSGRSRSRGRDVARSAGGAAPPRAGAWSRDRPGRRGEHAPVGRERRADVGQGQRDRPRIATRRRAGPRSSGRVRLGVRRTHSRR